MGRVFHKTNTENPTEPNSDKEESKQTPEKNTKRAPSPPPLNREMKVWHIIYILYACCGSVDQSVLHNILIFIKYNFEVFNTQSMLSLHCMGLKIQPKSSSPWCRFLKQLLLHLRWVAGDDLPSAHSCKPLYRAAALGNGLACCGNWRNWRRKHPFLGWETGRSRGKRIHLLMLKEQSTLLLLLHTWVTTNKNPEWGWNMTPYFLIPPVQFPVFIWGMLISRNGFKPAQMLYWMKQAISDNKTQFKLMLVLLKWDMCGLHFLIRQMTGNRSFPRGTWMGFCFR